MLFEGLMVLLLKFNLVVSNVQITIPAGQIQGSTLVSRLGKTIFAFRGIPFAKPPIGELRFKDPVPFENWTGIYNATMDGPACNQFLLSGLTALVSEDCLFLNVYSTKLPDKDSNPNRPVIIYIYGGGFIVGTGRSEFYGPQYFMDKDIVLVTFNYRLASLGFLAVGKESPGNYGFKDQVLVMKWVKKNIKAFGGDPNSVTLYGYSAGACSISVHLVSPMSRGLFHKAIMSSCTMYGPWSLQKNQLDIAKKQARLLGCPDDTPANIVNCLRTKPAQDIANTSPLFFEFAMDPAIIWGPVIEPNYGQKRFLVQHPIQSIMNGNFEEVPVLAGIAKEELANKVFGVISNPILLKQLNDDFEKWAPIAFCYERDTEKSKRISRQVRQFYLNNEPIDPANNASVVGLRNIYADAVTGFGVNRAVDLISKISFKPVYYYDFTYRSKNASTPGGPYHGDDGRYFFQSIGTGPLDLQMVETLTTLWTNFAKTGNPNSPGELEWKSYNVVTKYYYDIGDKLILKNHLHEKRYAFWRRVLPVKSYL